MVVNHKRFVVFAKVEEAAKDTMMSLTVEGVMCYAVVEGVPKVVTLLCYLLCAPCPLLSAFCNTNTYAISAKTICRLCGHCVLDLFYNR